MHLVKEQPLWSLSKLSQAFEIDRRRCATLLQGIVPAGENRGHPVYRLLDVALPLATYKAHGTTVGIEIGDERDPEQMSPKWRKEEYEGTLKRMEIEVKRGELTPTAVHREKLAEVAKIVKPALESLSDTVEAMCDLPLDAIELIDQIANEVLTSVANKMEA